MDEKTFCKIMKVLLLTIYLVVALSVGVAAYQNKADIYTWCKNQVEMCRKECKIRCIKEQFLRLQQKYGPDGAIEA